MKTIRWILVLPLSLLLCLLTDFPVHFVLYNSFDHFEPIERTIAPFFRGAAFVVIGYYIAPTGKFYLSSLLVWLWSIAAIVVFLIYADFTHLLTYVAVGLGILGSILGVNITRQIDIRRRKDHIAYLPDVEEKKVIEKEKMTPNERQMNIDIVNSPDSSFSDKMDSKLLLAIDEGNYDYVNEILDTLELMKMKETSKN
jgi:energy-converting hydrogenase Eha subunit E